MSPPCACELCGIKDFPSLLCSLQYPQFYKHDQHPVMLGEYFLTGVLYHFISKIILPSFQESWLQSSMCWPRHNSDSSFICQKQTLTESTRKRHLWVGGFYWKSWAAQDTHSFLKWYKNFTCCWNALVTPEPENFLWLLHPIACLSLSPSHWWQMPLFPNLLRSSLALFHFPFFY